jgi:hypothetical protein
LGIAPVEFLEHGGLGKLHCKARLSPQSNTTNTMKILQNIRLKLLCTGPMAYFWLL